MFSSPFPNFVSFSCLEASRYPGAAERLTSLYGEEFSPLKSSSQARRAEFYLGRLAAHTALSELSPVFEKTTIPVGQKREPVWPPGTIGSISHSSGFAVAAAAWKDQARMLGLDLENCDRKISSGISRHVARGAEQDWINEESAGWQERAISVFSAKEAVFKALYPLSRRVFGFKDVLLTPVASDCFRASLTTTLCPELPGGFQFEVHLQRRSSLLLSSVLINPEAD